MTTLYSMADSLPRDSGGNKFSALIDIATSQSDFALQAGIGSKTTGSKIVGAMWVGTNVAGSKIEPTGGVGVALMAHWSSAASPTATQNAIHLRSNDRGELYQVSLAGAVSIINAASTETATTASGIIYRAVIAGCGVIAGGQVAIMNNATCLGHVVFAGANESIFVDYGPGACFGGIRLEKRGTIGSVYVTLITKPYGQ